MKAGGDREGAEAIVLAAAGRSSVGAALAWIAEEHPLSTAICLPDLLEAIVELQPRGDVALQALRRVVRDACQSDFDTAKVVFDPDGVRSPDDFRRALDELLSRTPNRRFDELTPRAIQLAQYANSLAIEVLCLAVGVPYNDACDWFGGATGWTVESIAKLFEYLSSLVNDEVKSPLPNSAPGKAVELMFGTEIGWAALDKLVAEGVPYPILLSQRDVGGVWLSHKNKTSSYPNRAAADLLCAELAERGVDYRRASTVGGSSKQKDLQQLSGVPKKQIGLVILNGSKPTMAVAFSSARDGGTARANGDGLLQIPAARLPTAIMLTGPGWAGRQETDRLALHFNGLLFTEKTLDNLVAKILESLR